MAELVLKGLYKGYSGYSVIRNLDLRIGNGEFVTLLGPSGCGKTTLLRMIAGLTTIDRGELEIGGIRCTDMPAQKRGVAMVFQSYALFPHMSVRGNILFGLRMMKASRELRERRLGWVIDMLGLGGLESRLPRELSGGQRQRVALARALVLDPAVLLLDEPLSNLDAALREMAMEELKRVHRKVGTTVVYVTHNQSEAMSMSDRIALLNEGSMEQCGPPREVYDAPATVFAARFIGAPTMNFFKGTIERHDGGAGVRTPIGFLILDKERFTKVPAMEGRDVTVAVRPQHVSLSEHRRARRYSDTSLDVAVELVQSMGDRCLVVGRAAEGTALRFLITREAEFPLDSSVSVFVDGRRIHLFDPASGRSLLNRRVRDQREPVGARETME